MCWCVPAASASLRLAPACITTSVSLAGLSYTRSARQASREVASASRDGVALLSPLLPRHTDYSALAAANAAAAAAAVTTGLKR